LAGVAQLVRAPVCGTGGRGFKSPYSPQFIMRQWRNGRRTGFRLYNVGVAHLQTPLLFTFSNLYGISRCASLKLALEKIWSLDKLSCLCRDLTRQPRQKVLFALMQATESLDLYMRQWRNGRRTGFRYQRGNSWGFKSLLAHQKNKIKCNIKI
jgi:hypothetical protein